jgi:hypothetical protein
MGGMLAIITFVSGTQTGCVSTESAYSLGGATIGGLAGALASARNPRIAPFAVAGGAAAGGLISGMMIKSVKSGRYAVFQEGYQQGASDTAKRQYWILQNLQKERNNIRQMKDYNIINLAHGWQ